MVYSHGIPLKKQFGQHFLRDQSVIETIVDAVKMDASTNVFEIGCGDGVLTRGILSKPIHALWVFEIDQEWVEHITKTISDKRMSVFHENILDIDFKRFEADKPWTLLANLPYQVTFPILYRLVEHREFWAEGVVMVQEEVAQKIVKTSGRGYGFNSLYLQHFFEWKLLRKIPPSAFFPPPKVNSRLMYFKPRAQVPSITHEEQFWKFIKVCFKFPRRTLRNNLVQSHFDLSRIDAKTLGLRAQQMSINDLISLWNVLNTQM
jgi:16S rRNA (adenine1518-N6/adenine1519-N6)-dimethyltransferase